EALVSQIRKILRTAGQHNIALLGAGHLGQAIASSDIFADHGFRVVAIFDVDPDKVGTTVGNQVVRHTSELRQVVEDEDIVVGVLAVPGAAAQGLANELVDAGVKIIFNYSESLLAVPPEVTVHTSSPAVDLLYALYFYLTWSIPPSRGSQFEKRPSGLRRVGRFHRRARGGVRAARRWTRAGVQV